MSSTTPSTVQYAWYGDDFTGSTDVLEALALHGVPAVLFTGIPDADALASFARCRAVGIAGESRSRSPQWMDEHLPPIFAAMRSLGAPLNHYKVCSTFDSAPHIGNIGRAMELGLRSFAGDFVPIVVSAPHLGRTVAYGNLFAAAQGTMHRIDRHPAMRAHPVTPMQEADLRLHLAEQTLLPIGLIDLTTLHDDTASQHLQSELAAGKKAVLFDGVSYVELDETAELLWQRAARQPLFAVGSSGLTYGILRVWRRLGMEVQSAQIGPPAATERLLVLSGSCSPATAAQILHARQQGFTVLQMHGSAPWPEQTAAALASLAQGRSVILHTAAASVHSNGGYGAEFSAALGATAREILLQSGVRRIAIAGGDTSSHAVRQLGIRALTFAAQLAPGAPLCRAWSPGSPLHELELVLKGGQVGPASFFVQTRDGC